MSRPQMELSGVQVVASLLAALTGAVAASFLGVAGTIIGTAVMSVAGTAGAAIYRHYLARSKERLQAAAAAAKTRHPGQYGAGGPGQPQVGSAGTARDPASAAWGSPAAVHDTSMTREPGMATGTGVTRGMTRRASHAHPDAVAAEASARAGGYPGAWPADLLASRNGSPNGRDADPTQMMPRLNGYGDADRAGGSGGHGGAPGGTAIPWWRRRWVMLAGASLALFLVVMAGVTVVELIAGKPLNSLLTGSRSSGTSVGHVLGGSGIATSPAPSSSHSSPAASQQPTSTPAPSPSSSAAPAPSPSSSSPAPTPTSPAGGSGPPGSSGSPNPAVGGSQAP